MKKAAKRAPRKWALPVSITLFLLSILIWASYRWLEWYFADLTLEKVVFQMFAPAAGTNMDIIFSYLGHCIPPVIIAAAILFFLRRKKHLRAVTAVLAPVSFIGALVFGVFHFGVPDYVYNQTHPTTLYENEYVNPETAELVFPEKKRNLIYIFLESFETTFASAEYGGYQPENLLPNLTRLQRENVYFQDENGYGMTELANCSWTMAAMVAQTGGIPLSIPLARDDYGMLTKFLPGITNLGDILDAHGYTQELLIGSEAVFAGTDLYFEQHGNYRIRDYRYALDNGWIPEDYHEWWGYEDEKLFAFAKKELDELSKSDQPFNLTMATLDTHCVDGYVCRQCPDTYENQYYNVIACADRQLSEFIAWAQEQPWYENTTIILCGDHLTMDGHYSESVDNDFNRTIFNLIVNPANGQKASRKQAFSSLDLFPTTLAALGVDIPGNRLGLGTNLFSGEDTLCERMGAEELSAEIKKYSRYYNRRFLYD